MQTTNECRLPGERSSEWTTKAILLPTRSIPLLVLLPLFFLLAACASELVRTPTILKTSTTALETIELVAEGTVSMGLGNEKILPVGSKWQGIGALEQGRVFKPVGAVFNVHGANAHEAYLVIENDLLVGFYLPGERAWSNLERKIRLQFKSLR